MTEKINHHVKSPLAVGAKTTLVANGYNTPSFFPGPGNSDGITKQYAIGDEVTIAFVSTNKSDTGSGVGYRFDDQEALFDSSWFAHPADSVEGIIVADLSASRWETARAYALKQRSRLLTLDENAVLTDAGNGYPVDVIKFQKAVQAALSLAATRAGQSPLRREWTKECRHLLYWANAVIDAHVEGLPAFDSKEARSRKVRSLEDALSVATHEVEVLKANQANTDYEVAKTLREAREEIGRLTREAARREVALENSRARTKLVRDRLNTLRRNVGGLQDERDRWASTVEYIGTKFPETLKVAVAYHDGLTDAVADL